MDDAVNGNHLTTSNAPPPFRRKYVAYLNRSSQAQTTANCPPEDFSRMRTMVFNSSLTYPRVKEIYTAICSCGNSALKKMVWDITDLGNFRILQTVLAILHSAKRLNRSKKPKVTIMIRLYEGQGEMGGLGSEGGEGRGIYNAIWPDLYNLLNSEMSSYICILFTKFVTRLELFGRDLYTFSSRFPQSYIWTMNELRELLVDGQSTQLNGRSLQCLLDIVSRSPDITRPRTRTLKPAQPLQQLIIQNIRLFDIQWSQLLTSIDWLTIRRVSFRGSDFKNGNLVKLETEVIRLVMQCRDKQRVLSKNGLSDEDAAMVQGLKARQGGDAPLLVSLYHTDVTIDQILETRERLHKQGIRWCIFPMNDI
ncbi:hypothetical protein BGX30_011836 [Mortierella sp. GBA39]|nr:hypothetical protein BGX30_011836 [Mortierella sp. GBA39]